MHFVLNSLIQIGNFRFKGVHNLKIEKSIHEYADRAVIALPTSSVIKHKNITTESVQTAHRFKVGDKVNILLGYNGKKKEEFVGFIKQINPTTPCEIECEGYSWILRNKKNITTSWKNTTLIEVLKEVVKGTEIKLHKDIPNVSLRNIVINNASGTQVIEYIKGLFKGTLTAYFIDDTLYMGLTYIDLAIKTVKYRLRWNTIDGDSLKFKRADDVQVQIELNFKKSDGSQITTKTGTPGGIVRTDTITAVSDEKTLKEIAEAKLKQEAFDGYEGSFDTKLIPFVQHGWRAELEDRLFPERSGNYFIESVTTTFGENGGTRTIELGIKLS
ncbi:MAG: hypothetical protein M9958_00430 [Chitinophagales bacterium]|nr:hypothetical protein [Chitinophagales bacterium]